MAELAASNHSVQYRPVQACWPGLLTAPYHECWEPLQASCYWGPFSGTDVAWHCHSTSYLPERISTRVCRQLLLPCPCGLQLISRYSKKAMQLLEPSNILVWQASADEHLSPQKHGVLCQWDNILQRDGLTEEILCQFHQNHGHQGMEWTPKLVR